MKINSSLLILVAALVLSMAQTSAANADTLWNLSFAGLAPGQPLKEVAYSASCSGPQRVLVDASDSLTGTKALGTLTTPLLFTKGGTTNYMPSLTLKATDPVAKGIITVTTDVLFDKITPSAASPVETLMAFPFIDGDGGSTYIVTIACSGADTLVMGGAGLAKWATTPTFAAGTVAHLKFVLDLNQHTFQAFLNDAPMGPAETDATKFTSFLGLTVRDGTALGGNHGATFTAGIGSLVVTHD
jgi:hypothetical protein